MELPPDLFLELSEGARYEQVAGFGAERRQATRYMISLDAAVLRLNAGPKVKPFAAIVRDLSARGAGFETSEAFRVGELFALRLLRRDGTPVWLQCEVARWGPISEDRFNVGGKFVKAISGVKPPEAELVAPAVPV